MKKFFLTAILAVAGLAAMAQDTDKVGLTLSTDLVNQYIWRGLGCGNVSLQPTLGIDYKGLSLTAWGSVGLSEPADTKEFDLTAAYSINGFNIGITDYWFNAGLDPENRYFKYDAHGTNHLFEANIGYDFGPAAIQCFTNFAGNDGVNKKGKRAYSTYVEVSSPFKLASADWNAAVGAVPFATSFYDAKKFTVTNVSLKATKDIQITEKFHVPVFGQIVANPCSQKAYFVVGITLQP